jgi:hypothetical protein
MLLLPTPSAAVAQVAVRILPLPDSALAPHPVIVVPPLVKLTLPVGAVPVTVAVNVTLVPAGEGLSELARPVVLVPVPTDWDSVDLVEPV